MGKTSSASKNKWNAAHYAQIKIAVDPQLAEDFKALCRAENTTVTGELSGFMAARCGAAATSNRQKKDPLSTRGGRRKLLNELIRRLDEIKAAEETYLSNIPANLQGSDRYEAAEQSVTDFENALESLSNVYG
jgi:hypothetical protein